MAGLIIVTLCAVTGALYMAWKMWRMKKEVYQFADSLDKNLDLMISGQKLENTEDIQDSLWSKVNEKLGRTAHIWERRNQESLEEKQMIKELISDISHQTKTPIANQKIYLELLRQEPLSEKGKEFVVKLESQTEKLDFLFRSMVKMSRLEAGIIRIQREKSDLIQTLSQAVASIVPAAAKGQIALSADCKSQLLIPHDRKWTEEAIYNILDNAVKYTGKGGEIHITVSRQEIFTKISIKDNGKGIPLERQAQIFTRFYREPEVHDKDGIGIGLYLARKIVELQKGYIEVRSEPGKGSDFQIYLPNE